LQENGERGEGQREEEGRADVINAYMTVWRSHSKTH
jgi:hypothetical protein